MHFQGLKFAQMITNVRNLFPGRLSDTMFKQTVQIIASNASIVEAHGLECRTLGRLTQTFTVCIEEPINKVKWCTADNYQFDHTCWSQNIVGGRNNKIYKSNLTKIIETYR